MSTPLNRSLRAGIAAAQAKQFERARPLLEDAVQHAPDDALAWFWLAAVSPNAARGIECLRRVLAIDPSHAQAPGALARLLVSQATDLASSGDRRSARAFAAEAARLTPGNQHAWLALAALSEDQVERIEALRHASALDDTDPQIKTKLRQALVYRGLMLGKSDKAGARALFTEAAALNPADARVWQALANLAETPAEAIAPLREFVRLSPASAGGRVALKRALAADAQTLASADRRADACARWRDVVAIDDHDVDAWLGVADATDDDEELQQALDTAAALAPDDERVAAALEQFRLPDEAFAPSLDAFERFEPSVDALNALDEPESLGELDAPDALPAFEVPVVQRPRPVPVATPRPPKPQPLPPVEPDLVVPEPAAEPSDTSVPAPAPPPLRVVPPPAPQVAAVVEPTARAATVVDNDDRVPAAPDAPPTNGSRRTVMVVDDSPTIRKILGLTLERAGYKVVAEPDGESAVERLNQVLPDLILLDIAMPKLDGYEVCKRIKKDPRTAHIPIVMLSGKDAFFDKVKGHMAGATEYLTKPFETPAVLAVVNTHCHAVAEAVNG